MLKKTLLFFTMWTCLHYTASHLYTRLCTPWTLSGFLFSPFVTVSPHCMALRWMVATGSDRLNLVWITLGSLSSDLLTKYR